MGGFAALRGFKPMTIPRTVRIRYIPPILISLLCSILLLWYLVAEDYATEPEVWQILPDDALAPRLKASDIISQPLASGKDLSLVTKYIHQSWMNDELPGRLTRWSQTCRAQHRHWRWILWTDDENRKMVEKYFPWFLDTYRALPAEINRADASRNMYMYLFGGVYADLDTECLQPLDQLFQEHGVGMSDPTHSQQHHDGSLIESDHPIAFFGRMGYDGTDETLFHTVPNAWMAASPGHPFFLLVLERLQEAVATMSNEKYHTTAEDLTGPVALFHAIEEYDILVRNGSSFTHRFRNNTSYDLFSRTSDEVRMNILPPVNIYPYSWNNQGKRHRKFCWATRKTFNTVKCKQAVTTNQTYTITYWSHTWNKDLHKTHNSHNIDINKKLSGS